MKRMVWTCLLALVLSVAMGALVTDADEGMWPLYSLNDLDFDALQARGLQLGADQIFNEKDGGIAAAIVQVGGGTGSFVSPKGLILTNHHVAFAALQKQSKVDDNVLHNGFLAPTLADEVPAIGYQAYVTKSFTDVTDQIKGALTDDMSDLDRYKAIEKKEKEIVDAAEAKGDLRCHIASFYGGSQYYLVSMLRIQDVRIVYAPPQSIGEFGGDIDNWMWPRHTGDFSFLRAYVAPDGSGAEYAEDNVPYQSTTYLPVSSGPLHEGDFTMIIGYPGHTVRYRSSYAVNEVVTYDYPNSVKTITDLLDIMEASSAADPEAAIKLSGTMKSLNNYLKNTQGQLTGLKRANLLEKKQQQEAELVQFLTANPDQQEKFGDVLPALKAHYDEVGQYRDQDNAIGMMGWVCRYYRFANSLYRWSIEKEKPDMEREPRYMERNRERMKCGLEEAQITLEPATDAQLLEYFVMRALRLPEGERITGIDKYFPIEPGADTAAIVHSFVNGLYTGTKVGDVDQRLAMFEMPKDELVALNDPFINLARDLYDQQEEMRNRSKAMSGRIEKLRPRFIEELAAWKGKGMYPDANGTIRLNYGQVKGYSPQDGASYTPFTTLSGVVAKETGEEPFANPQPLLNIYKSGDYGKYRDPELNDVPVNVLTTNDGTGGNSGSPILNGKGEVIGLDFDSNWEGIVGDWVYDPVLKRSIIVDSRYVLFVLDQVYHAQNVVDELTVH